MNRLNIAGLAALPASVGRPAYDRSAIRIGVVHLGIGAFHRAHQAPVFEAALAAGDDRWGICAVSMRSGSVRDQLEPQDGLYTLAVRDGATETLSVIGAVRRVLVAPDDPAAVIDALAAPDTHIVTLTITEKGYRLDPASGALRLDDADVAADCASLARPATAIGFIVAALARRRDAGLPPFTAISCDNLPHNGRRLRDAVLAMAAQHDEGLCAWIADQGAFPQTMIDRIVPATSGEDIVTLAGRLGILDRAMVKTEPFTQWVIEDRFAGPRPDFAALGVQITDAVAPWEEAKLRLLNGAHSAIAYLGALAGIAYVHEVVALGAARGFVEALWDEAEATLDPPAALDIADYRAALMARFANPALEHRTVQIAMDGSQKIPQRLLATIADRLRRGLPVDALSLAVAAWMRWQSAVDDAGQDFVVDDPLAALTAARLAGCATSVERVAALLSIEAIFPPVLAEHVGFAALLAEKLEILTTRGALAALEPWSPKA